MGALVGTLGPAASAQVDAVQLSRAVTGAPPAAVRAVAIPEKLVSAAPRLPVLVEATSAAARAELGKLTGGIVFPGGFGALEVEPARLIELQAKYPNLRFTWAPPRRLMLDNADKFTFATDYHEQTGQSGEGAAVAVLDTGIDVSHPNFLTETGATRIAWMIDFSRPPTGQHPELEARFGCDKRSGYQCAIYDSADIEAMRAKGTAPKDPIGHGTHVTSLAAGNGQAPPIGRYVGVAPKSPLIIAKVTRGELNQIFDIDIVVATNFVFDRGDAMGVPVTANLSLGSDFGPHDGTGPLARALAAHVGPEFPGHAIVVASGNNGQLAPYGLPPYPDPLGIHTEVYVPPHSPTRVPIVTIPYSSEAITGTVFLWIAQNTGENLTVGFEFQDGETVDPLSPGESGTFEHDDVTVTIVNGNLEEYEPLETTSPGSVVVVNGTWESRSVFGVKLGGRGSAQMWIDARTEDGQQAAWLSRATKIATVGEPAASPELVAVGATLNRLSWRDYTGALIRVPSFGGVEDPPLQTLAYFSGAGPNAVGAFKPDLVAPGALVIGAMAAAADPRNGAPASIFNGGIPCPDQTYCQVVNDYYAVTLGTSMAAPQVSGAFALMFERDPTLTQAGALALLQAGAEYAPGLVPVQQQMGVGTLDLVGALAAQTGDTKVGPPSSARSWMVLGDTFARANDTWPLQVMLELRDADDALVDGFEPSQLTLDTDVLEVSVPLTTPGSRTLDVFGRCPR